MRVRSYRFARPGIVLSVWILAASVTGCGHPAGSSTTSGAGGTTGNGGSSGTGNGGSGTGSGGSSGGGGAGGGETIIGTDGGAGGTVGPMSCGSATGAVLPYTPGYVPDPTIHAAAMNLAMQMSDTEKAQQMRGLTQSGSANYNVFRQEDNTARGIKAFLFRDGPRGVNINANGDSKSDFSTAFPVAMARGAAFDVDLEYHIGQAVGDETLSSGNTMILAPTTNILRHPLWGRAQETYGEDPYLLGRLGSAFVVGVQEYVAACAKHYAANNIENGRATATAAMDEQTLHEIYARHFQMMVEDGGVSAIMAAYNLLKTPLNPGGGAVKSTQNQHLLDDLLRGEFGFKGFVLSDWWAMPNGNNVPLPAANVLQDTAVGAVTAGLDMELPWSYNYSTLPSLVPSRLSSTQLAASAALILEQKMRFKVDKLDGTLGLKPPTTTYNTGTASIENNQAHIDLAEQGALESMVLLKNDNKTLPINRATVHNIAVIGATVTYTVNVVGQDAGRIDFTTNVRTGDLGSSRVFADPAKSMGPLAGIQLAAGSGITVNRASDASAVAAADFVVVVAGLTPQDEGEEYTQAGDRRNLSLDGKNTTNAQNTLITNVAAMASSLNKPMVVVLEGGSVIDMSPWLANVPAVVMAWYPGMVGGKALGKLLFGDVNFSGKLPISWPKSLADEPVFSDPSGVTSMDYYLGYRWFDRPGSTATPQFAFGYGMSYTTFSYSNIQVPCSTVAKDGVVNVTVDVANTGSAAGDEVAFAFVSFPSTTLRRGPKELKGFKRFTLAKPDPANSMNGSAKRITIPIRVSDLKVYDATQNKMIVESGPVQVWVGPSYDKLTAASTMFMVQ
jgi:beta-glucosidase